MADIYGGHAGLAMMHCLTFLVLNAGPSNDLDCQLAAR